MARRTSTPKNGLLRKIIIRLLIGGRLSVLLSLGFVCHMVDLFYLSLVVNHSISHIKYIYITSSSLRIGLKLRRKSHENAEN